VAAIGGRQLQPSFFHREEPDSMPARLFLAACSAIVLTVCLAGCGEPAPESSEPIPPQELTFSSKEQIKEMLNAMVQTGTGHSGVPGIRNTIESWKATEPELAEDLLKDMDALEAAMQANNAAQVRQIAKRMADKL
jgi:hypothetical protein